MKLYFWRRLLSNLLYVFAGLSTIFIPPVAKSMNFPLSPLFLKSLLQNYTFNIWVEGHFRWYTTNEPNQSITTIAIAQQSCSVL